MTRWFALQRLSGIFAGGWDIYTQPRKGSFELTPCEWEDAERVIVPIQGTSRFTLKYPQDINIRMRGMVPVVGMPDIDPHTQMQMDDRSRRLSGSGQQWPTPDQVRPSVPYCTKQTEPRTGETAPK